MYEEKLDYSNIIKHLGAAWRDLMARTPDFMFIKNTDLVYMDASQAFAELVGLSSSSEVVGRTDYDIFEDKSLAERYRNDDRRLLESGEALLDYIEPIPPKKDGTPRYSSTSKYVFRDEAGSVIGLYAIGRDVTREYVARVRYEREIDFLLKPKEGVIASTLLDVTLWQIVKVYTGGVNESDGDFFKSPAEFGEYSAAAVVEDEDVRLFFNSLTKDALRSIYDSGSRFIEMEYLREMPDGTQRWVRDEGKFISDPTNGHVMLLITLNDINDMKRTQSELARALEKDSMTGLLNHDATIRHIGRFLEMEGINGTHALFMVDIDNFKQVNDTFGHQTGDDVITDVATMIKRTFRDSDIVGRVGGDEFIAFMKNVGSKRILAKKAAELVDMLQYNINANNANMQVSGSIGISIYKGDAKPFDKLYAEADAALYKAKSKGKNCFSFADFSGGERDDLSLSDGDMSSAVHLRTLLEDIDGGVIVCEANADATVSIVYASPSLFKAFNRSRDEIGEDGRKMFSTILPEDRLGFENAVLTSAFCGSVMDYTYRVSLRDGGVAWRHARGSRLPDNGGARRVICVLTDITEIKKIEDELKLAEQRRSESEEILRRQKIALDTLLYSLPGGIFTYSAEDDEQFTFISENMLKMLGYTRDEFVAKFDNRFSKMIWREDRERVLKEINDQTADAVFNECEYRIETADGKLMWVHDVGHLVVDGSGKSWFYVVIIDITSRKEK